VRVLSIGHFTIDEVWLPGGVHVSHLFGGDCVYSAVGAAVWGATVGTISVVGKDYPEAWITLLRQRGIRTDGLRALAVRHQLVAQMVYDDKGRRQNERESASTSGQVSRRVRSRRWNTFSPRIDDARNLTGWADAVHIAGMPIRRQNDFLRLFHGVVPLITVDLPWPPDLYPPGTVPQVELASAVLLSEAEMKGLFPGRSIDEVGQALMARGAKIVALKRGARGSIVFHEGRPLGCEIPSLAVDVVDPTGAGDAYCGGFLVGLSETGNAEIAAQYGTVSASFVIEGFGAGHGLRHERNDAIRRLAQVRPAVYGNGSQHREIKHAG